VLNISKPIIFVYLCIGGIGGTLYKVLNISKPITKSIHAILMILAAGIVKLNLRLKFKKKKFKCLILYFYLNVFHIISSLIYLNPITTT